MVSCCFVLVVVFLCISRQKLCHKRVSVEIVTRRCETRYCCGKVCSCSGDIYTNSSACRSTFTELSCFVEHKEIRPYLIECCNGYRLNTDGMCVDIDECDPNPCEQGCRNFDGGFSCYCVRGFQISSDGRTCLEDSTCDNRCAHKCAKVRGKYRCLCRPTFVLGEDGASCHPRRRCRDGNNCEHICTDTETGFQCSCQSGYRLNHDGIRCDDINECLENTQLCDHECQNTIGRYHCYCDFGFRLNVTDGRSCIPGMTSLTIVSNACKFFYLSPRCLRR
ncbi:hypothetical protein NP493_1296g00001 [Ridgeia piscesae]|uniref:EGF-like domain-containing protein n=1 Tax=Ridgeia piscesae TaxID=27915 RepID=A0AAD9K942_RIDPI|nr:hypothetical protein NP493_1296g00001 [Ridgeia piscesae]